MICDICGIDGVKIRLISRAYGQGKDLLIIENIPTINCPHCGESYLSAQTLHKIEEIKRDRQSWAIERPVEVASFA
jgi:YgiT-type zinc finger domain-containing protein